MNFKSEPTPALHDSAAQRIFDEIHLVGLPQLADGAIVDGMFVIAAPDPRVFFVQSNTRRWVPDSTTLLAIAPNGWGDVIAVSADQEAALPEGTPVPSRLDGKVYLGANTAPVYVIESLLRHHIPDPETLIANFGGWPAVVVIGPQDLNAIPAGADIPSVLGGGNPIDGYLRSLLDLPVQSTGESHTPLGGLREQINGINYDVTQEQATFTGLQKQPNILAPVADVLFPGALVQAASLAGGLPAPLAGGLKRSGGTITVTTDLHLQGGGVPRSASRTVPKVDLPSIQDARTQLLHDLDPADGAAQLSFECHQARTVEHGMVKLGLSASSGAFKGDVSAQLDTSIEKQTVMAFFRQVFYQMAFTPPDGPDIFFDPSVTLNQVKDVCGQGNPAAYMAEVDYGRMLVVTMNSVASASEMKASLDAVYQAANAKVALSMTDAQKKVFDESDLQVMVLGGDNSYGLSVLHDPINSMWTWLTAGGVFTANNPGVPLSYTARYAGTRREAAINQTTTYSEAVAAVGVNADATFQVWDGPGGGPITTNIRVAQGDQLAISASGKNWSGVWATADYGPDGWTTWAKPSGSGYPLPNNHPFALAGAWDGTAVDPNAGNAWFYIGTGINTVASFGQNGPTSRVLYLGTNDNNPLNGDAAKKFSVNVHVTRSALPNVGRAVV